MKELFLRQCYQYLAGQIPPQKLFDFIYDHPELRQELTEEHYQDLLGINYHIENLEVFLFETHVDKGAFLSWRLADLLENFIEQPTRVRDNLRTLYEFYDETSHAQGDEDYWGWEFLSYLGGYYFSYMHTLDEWHFSQTEEEVLEAFLRQYPHSQLKQVASLIKDGLDQGEIIIARDYTYTLSANCQAKLASFDLFKQSP